MRNLFLILLLAVISTADAQVSKTIKHRGLDQDLKLCVNDGGSESCPLVLDGPTGNAGFGLSNPTTKIDILEPSSVSKQTSLKVRGGQYSGSNFAGGLNISVPDSGNNANRYWDIEAGSNLTIARKVTQDDSDDSSNGTINLDAAVTVGQNIRTRNSNIKVGDMGAGTTTLGVYSVSGTTNIGFIRLEIVHSRNNSGLRGAEYHEALVYHSGEGELGTPVVSANILQSGININPPNVFWSGTNLNVSFDSTAVGGSYHIVVYADQRGGTDGTFL